MKSKSFYLESVASTQDTARDLLQQNSKLDAVWVRSSFQSQGRGRQGRTWTGPRSIDDSLLCSIALNNSHLKCGLELAPLAAGWAIHAAVGELKKEAVEIGLKWPNDLVVYRSGRLSAKVGGVLCEARGHPATLVIGWGVNVRGDVEGAPSYAKSIQNIFGVSITAQELFERLQLEFTNVALLRADELMSRISQGPMSRLWGAHGELPSGQSAVARSLGERGQLIVEVDGQLKSVSSGEFVLKYDL